jgi:hypothetical protein
VEKAAGGASLPLPRCALADVVENESKVMCVLMKGYALVPMKSAMIKSNALCSDGFHELCSPCTFFRAEGE